MISPELYQKRYDLLLSVMDEQEVACTVVCNSPNLFYMTGYKPKKDERLQIAFFPRAAEPVMIVPAIYHINAESDCAIADLRVWSDGDDLVALVRGVLEEKKLVGASLAIDDMFEFRQLQPIRLASPDSQLVLGSGMFTPLRMRKSPEELEAMAESGALSDEAVGMIIDKLLSGQSEAELKNWIEFELLNRGMVYGFSNLIACGVNTNAPHHVSGPRVPKMRDAVSLDSGGALKH